jgi:hypothetical protein
MKELVVTTNPFEGAVNQMLAFIKENGRGPEALKVLENVKRRFCINRQEEEAAQRAYETGKLQMDHIHVESPVSPARAR